MKSKLPFVKPPYVHATVVPELAPTRNPNHLMFRLYAGIEHLHFVFWVNEKQCDRFRLPWHFIRQIRKSNKSKSKLYIYLHESKVKSPAFQSRMPTKYFPNVLPRITLRIVKERKQFLKGLKLDGLILKKKDKDKTDKKKKYFVPQTLEFKWKYFYILPYLSPDDTFEAAEYLVEDEQKVRKNLPRIIFEQGLDPARVIPPEKSKCTGDLNRKHKAWSQVKFGVSHLFSKSKKSLHK